MHRVFTGIASLPAAGHRRPDLTSRDLRFVSSGHYLVVYDANARPIRIIRVLHGSRDVRRLLEE